MAEGVDAAIPDYGFVDYRALHRQVFVALHFYAVFLQFAFAMSLFADPYYDFNAVGCEFSQQKQQQRGDFILYLPAGDYYVALGSKQVLVEWSEISIAVINQFRV